MFNGFAFDRPLCGRIKVNLRGLGLGCGPSAVRSRGSGALGLAHLGAGGRRRGWGRSADISFSTTFGAFLIVLVSLTAVIWITQALRDIDLMTNQGQTILVFVGITGLIIPLLVLVIAPIALMIAVAHVLNKLSNDSEIIVMNAAGMSPWVLFRPFLPVAIVVSMLCRRDQRLSRAQGPAHAARLAHRSPRRPGDQHRAARPLHRDRARPHLPHPRAPPNGQLLGIFVDDRRDPEGARHHSGRAGRTIEKDNGTFLVLQKGSVQRKRDRASATRRSWCSTATRSICRSSPAGRKPSRIRSRERYLWQLLNPDPKRSSSTSSSRASSAPNCTTA